MAPAGAYLDWMADGGTVTGVKQDRAVLHTVIEPGLGAELAALVSAFEIETALRDTATIGASREEVREGFGLRRTYRWAIHRRWCTDDPTSGITTSDVTM